MKFKMLAVDLDGTLLNRKKEISIETINAIQSYRNIGGRVVICSGRTPLSTKWISEYIGLNEPIIAYNGAIIQTANGEIIEQSIFQETAIFTLLDFAHSEGMYIQMYEGDRLLISEENEINLQWIQNNIPLLDSSSESATQCENYRRKCDVMHVGNWLDYFKESNPSIMKIAVFNKKKTTNLLTKMTQLAGDFEISSSFNFENLEISPGGVTKAAALLKLSEQLQIPISQVAAIGDNFNDIQMLKTAGLGIAMGNAPEEVKNKADAITSTNEESGVAKAIQKYLLS
ncbi:Cof-type HAD-IIB family hydrolase [Bacillus sp. 03113]|uniref:Cof-type HAD-IIB family hydrolase n=1 Tax=Bacillus sp. 03113 TaxID=2578211 RepID=UPI0015E87DE5|nr:Cof-type HAD-IIB family hydrolase [Bacillus sp. 03113]